MKTLLFAGYDLIIDGILIPIVIGIFATAVRIALWGWHGLRHATACLCVGIFSGVCAHWILGEFQFSPTLNAVIISMAALFSSDMLRAVFSRRTLHAAANAMRKRLEHEILYRGRSREE